MCSRKPVIFTVPLWVILAGGVVSSPLNSGVAFPQTAQGSMKPVDDPAAEVWEFIAKRVPLQPGLSLHVPEIRNAEKGVTWDERKFSLAAWAKLRKNLASMKLFRKISVKGPADLTFRTTTLDAAPNEGMSGSLLEVEGRLLDNPTGNLLGRVRVLAVATGQAGEVSPDAAEGIPNRVAAALARFVRRALR